MYKVKNDIMPNVPRCNSRNPSQFIRDRANTTNNGIESIRILGPKIWDLVPDEIKQAGNLNSFKDKIRKWKIENFPCRFCKVFIRGVGYF